MKILHIAPALPPTVNGVGDYANILACAMTSQDEADLNILLAANTLMHCNTEPKYFLSPIKFCLSNSVPNLLNAVAKIAPDVIILNCVGYGYAKRGAPFWLLLAMRVLKKESPCLKIGTMFHELYATTLKPWKSAFWLSSAQRYIACSLARLSDFWVTNSEKSALWLNKYAKDKPNACLPVFSNVGESNVYKAERIPRLIVFGGSKLRIETYKKSGEQLFAWTRSSGIKIHDIGPKIEDVAVQRKLLENSVEQHGVLPTVGIADLMKTARFGLISYSIDSVAKSGVFAALCAYGVTPVLLSEKSGHFDGLLAGKHYLPGIPSCINKATLSGEHAWEWYKKHNVSVHAQTFLNLIRGV